MPPRFFFASFFFFTFLHLRSSHLTTLNIPHLLPHIIHYSPFSSCSPSPISPFSYFALSSFTLLIFRFYPQFYLFSCLSSTRFYLFIFPFLSWPPPASSCTLFWIGSHPLQPHHRSLVSPHMASLHPLPVSPPSTLLSFILCHLFFSLNSLVSSSLHPFSSHFISLLDLIYFSNFILTSLPTHSPLSSLSRLSFWIHFEYLLLYLCSPHYFLWNLITFSIYFRFFISHHTSYLVISYSTIF